MSLVRAVKLGIWNADSMAHQLDEDLLPESPFPGPSAAYVWDLLRDLQATYQDRETGWERVPPDFERLARVLPTLAALA